MTSTLNILWVATKPPWPPIDGGRLVMALMLEALLVRGHTVQLVAPITGTTLELPTFHHPNLRCHWLNVRRTSFVNATLRSLLGRLPVALERHSSDTIRRHLADLLRTYHFDLVHCEQLQSVASVPHPCPAPIVLRAQNVESALWAQAASKVRGPLGVLGRREARRLERAEGDVLDRVDLTLAVTRSDREQLQRLSGRARVVDLSAAFPSRLPPSSTRLDGDPAITLLARADWFPNREGARKFVQNVWPRLATLRPEAILYVFSDDLPLPRAVQQVRAHLPPRDSSLAFQREGLLIVPLAIASGVRIKILEAWARGVPVIASRCAARGLELDRHPDLPLRLAETPEEYDRAIGALLEARPRESQAGHRYLLAEHDPQVVARRYENLVHQLLDQRVAGDRRPPDPTSTRHNLAAS